MQTRKTMLAAVAILTAVFLAAAGILLNHRIPPLETGGTVTVLALQQGVALHGWEQTGADQWQFAFSAEPGAGTLALCLANWNAVEADDGLVSYEGSHEWYLIDPQPDGRVVLALRSAAEPRAWLMTPTHAQRSNEMRTILQLMCLTAFATMTACVLALFHYKRQWELGCFLIYLTIMFFWGLLVFLAPVGQGGIFQPVLRLFFSFAVLAQLWLSSALTGVSRPQTPRQTLLWGLVLAGLLTLGLSSSPWVRCSSLILGMALGLALLTRALARGVEGAHLLLLPCAVTVGLRVWALLPGLQASFFVECFPLYVLRCARIYDLPFALGCLVYVCRRFALQFDRTEQLARELDRRVAERTQALTEQTEARKSMMVNIFHDLRSPLFAVSSGLDTLASSPQVLPALLPALQERIGFVRRLTEDLFLAAKLEQKQLMLNEDRALLDRAAAAVCDACQTEAAQKGVLLRLHRTAELPVWGDEMRLEQIIQNLVTNAIHYTPAGGRVEVDCRLQENFALVLVRDTGCGIAPEDQDAVFDRYFHTTARTKHDSTGLGLTIARELARLHHGEITLESQVGVGSCFTLRLPLLDG
ncbi:MAG: sensor histidine kinase [Faecalibacterium sp.]